MASLGTAAAPPLPPSNLLQNLVASLGASTIPPPSPQSSQKSCNGQRIQILGEFEELQMILSQDTSADTSADVLGNINNR